jgi:amino acid permease
MDGTSYCRRPFFLTSLIVSTNATTVFGWFSNMTSVAGLLLWMSICITLIRSVPFFLSEYLLSVLAIQFRFRQGLKVIMSFLASKFSYSYLFIGPRDFN